MSDTSSEVTCANPSCGHANPSDAQTCTACGKSLKPGGNVAVRALRSYFREFAALKTCSREFWVVQLVNLLDGVAYFAMLTVSTLYLSETLGYDDAGAANLWAACMGAYTLMGFVAGFIGDSLGIKRTLYLSVVLLVASRLTVSVTEAKSIVIPALFMIAIGTAIMTPILISATKRYTTKENQTAGFNMLYFLMNIGAFLGNATLDPLRDLQWGNRTIFMMGSAMSILCWLSIFLLWHKGIDQVDAQQQSQSAEDKDEKWEAPWTIAASVMRESAFWRFMLFLVLLIGVRLVFEHQYQVYPKYYQRTIAEYRFNIAPDLTDELNAIQANSRDEAQSVSEAVRTAFEAQSELLSPEAAIWTTEAEAKWRIVDNENDYYLRAEDSGLSVYASEVPIGRLNSINPLIICFGVIISTPIVARFKLFNVLFFGIVVSAGSMVILMIYPGWFCEWFGLSLNQGYAVIVIAQIVVFSIGEMIWSPRLYEYTAAIAPKGREASYMGLSYAPMFFARSAEGPLAGSMLTHYCPPDIGSRLTTVPYLQSPQFMCVILGLIALASPVLIVLFRGVIQKESRLEQDEPAAAAEA